MGRRRANPVWSAAKGAREETRLLAEPRRLLAVFDKREDPHSPQLSYMYKAFTHCEIRAGELIQDTTETSVWTGYLSHSYKSSNPETLSTLVCGVRRILCLRSEPDSLPGFGRMAEA